MTDCLEVTDEMILEHGKLVDFTINRYFKWMKRSCGEMGVEYSDIRQTGMVGLVKAMKEYDSSKGKFSTAAVKYIHYEITKEHIRKHSHFKVSRDILKASRHMNSSGDYDVESIKQKFNMSEKAARTAIDFAKFNLISMDSMVGKRKKEPLIDITEDQSTFGQFSGIDVDVVTNKLTQKQKEALFLYLDGYGQAEIAKVMGTTQQYVSLLIKNAKAKVEREYHMATGGIVC